MLYVLFTSSVFNYVWLEFRGLVDILIHIDLYLWIIWLFSNFFCDIFYNEHFCTCPTMVKFCWVICIEMEELGHIVYIFLVLLDILLLFAQLLMVSLPLCLSLSLMRLPPPGVYKYLHFSTSSQITCISCITHTNNYELMVCVRTQILYFLYITNRLTSV